MKVYITLIMIIAAILLNALQFDLKNIENLIWVFDATNSPAVEVIDDWQRSNGD